MTRDEEIARLEAKFPAVMPNAIKAKIAAYREMTEEQFQVIYSTEQNNRRMAARRLSLGV